MRRVFHRRLSERDLECAQLQMVAPIVPLGVEAFRRFARCLFPFYTDRPSLDRDHGRFLQQPKRFATISAGMAYRRHTIPVSLRCETFRGKLIGLQRLGEKLRLRRKEAHSEIGLCGQ